MSWGIATTVLIVMLGLLQGFRFGCELPGTIMYLVEMAPRGAGFVFFYVHSCLLLAAVVKLTVHNVLTDTISRHMAGASLFYSVTRSVC